MIQIANFERVFIVKVNQFSLIQTDDATRRHELKALHLLMDGDENLSASQLLLALLLRTHLETTSDAGRAAWLKSLLATPTTGLKKTSNQPTPYSTCWPSSYSTSKSPSTSRSNTPCWGSSAATFPTTTTRNGTKQR